MENYYKTLNIPENSNLRAVKSAYYKLAKQYHPDYNQGDEDAGIKFRAINKAYAKINKLVKENCAILGITLNADLSEINRAFSILDDKYSRELKKGDKTAQHRLDAIQEAYDFLSKKVNHSSSKEDINGGW